MLGATGLGRWEEGEGGAICVVSDVPFLASRLECCMRSDTCTDTMTTAQPLSILSTHLPTYPISHFFVSYGALDIKHKEVVPFTVSITWI